MLIPGLCEPRWPSELFGLHRGGGAQRVADDSGRVSSTAWPSGRAGGTTGHGRLTLARPHRLPRRVPPRAHSCTHLGWHRCTQRRRAGQGRGGRSWQLPFSEVVSGSGGKGRWSTARGSRPGGLGLRGSGWVMVGFGRSASSPPAPGTRYQWPNRGPGPLGSLVTPVAPRPPVVSAGGLAPSWPPVGPGTPVGSCEVIPCPLGRALPSGAGGPVPAR